MSEPAPGTVGHSAELLDLLAEQVTIGRRKLHALDQLRLDLQLIVDEGTPLRREQITRIVDAQAELVAVFE